MQVHIGTTFINQCKRAYSFRIEKGLLKRSKRHYGSNDSCVDIGWEQELRRGNKSDRLERSVGKSGHVSPGTGVEIK